VASVGVVICCYRQAEFLEDAIESVRKQQQPVSEIVLIDDGSPDHTAEVAARYPDVRYVWQTNQGVSAARNRGIRETRSRYLVFLDADDRLLPNHLEASLAAFAGHPDAAFVCGDYRWFGAAGRAHYHDCTPRPDHFGALLRFNFIGPPHTVMFKRDILEAVGGFRPGLGHTQDQELYLRIARGYPIFCHHEVVAEYRHHPQQRSEDYRRMLVHAIATLHKQRPYLRRNPAYAEAYRAGLRYRRRLYGAPLTWQVVTAVRAGDWRGALSALWVLVRYYPEGPIALARKSLARAIRPRLSV
jgi:glycosyltransferase involved in cell wall biosynthesis